MGTKFEIPSYIILATGILFLILSFIKFNQITIWLFLFLLTLGTIFKVVDTVTGTIKIEKQKKNSHNENKNA